MEERINGKVTHEVRIDCTNESHEEILPGLTVGENAVVGAASVVTHDVESGTIGAGTPARVIKRID